MSDEARRLLEEGVNGFGRLLIATGDDTAVRDWQRRARTLLAQPEPAAREAVEAKRLREALEEAKAVLGPRSAAMYVIHAALASREPSCCLDNPGANVGCCADSILGEEPA